MINKAVITGPTGAIGMALINKLIAEGVETLVLCNPLSKRTSQIPKNKLLSVECCSLDSLNSFSFYKNKFDAFFHLGWFGTDKESRNNAQIQNSNIEFNLNALELAKRLGCKTFIGAGSQAEFGRTISLITENTPSNPETAYGIAKYEAERRVLEKAKECSIRAIWARIFSVYGPYDGEDTLISYMIKELILKRSPKLTACTQIWNYLYASDAAEALFRLAISQTSEGLYCIASEDTRVLKDFVLELHEIVAPDILLNFGDIPFSDGQVMSLKPDITKLKHDINFSPKVSFREGIAQTLKYIRLKHFS